MHNRTSIERRPYAHSLSVNWIVEFQYTLEAHTKRSPIQCNVELGTKWGPYSTASYLSAFCLGAYVLPMPKLPVLYVFLQELCALIEPPYLDSSTPSQMGGGGLMSLLVDAVLL